MLIDTPSSATEYIGTGNYDLGVPKTLAEDRSQAPVKIEPPYQEVFFLIKVL